MRLTAFENEEFKEIRKEFKKFPKQLDKAYGKPPGRAWFKGLRESSSGLLDKIASLGLFLSTLEIINGPFNLQMKNLAQGVYRFLCK